MTLRDTGVRDEHGMEPLENIFSSPEKSRANGAANSAESSDEGEDMDIDPTGKTGRVPTTCSLCCVLTRRVVLAMQPRCPTQPLS